MKKGMERRNFKEQRERLAEYGGELLFMVRPNLKKCLIFIVPGLFLIVLGISINPGVSGQTGYSPALKMMSWIALVVGCMVFIPSHLFVFTSSIRIYENALCLSSLAGLKVFFPEEIAYIRYVKIERVRQLLAPDQTFICIKTDVEKELRLSCLAYDDLPEYIRDWQKEHGVRDMSDTE